MAHTNQTPNYGLSAFVGSDKPAWLVDYNGDMEKIDLGLKAAKDVADAAKEEADQGALDIAAVTVTANTANTKASAAISNFAEAYDPTETYAVGDYVTYENLTYRCTVAITVPEVFDGTHWARVTMDSEITNLQGDVSANETAIANLNHKTFGTAVNIETGQHHTPLYDGYLNINLTNQNSAYVLGTIGGREFKYANPAANTYTNNEIFIYVKKGMDITVTTKTSGITVNFIPLVI